MNKINLVRFNSNRKVNIFTFLVILIISCKSENADFPFLIQENSKGCGPTCLKMIFKYYNKEIDLDSISKVAKLNDSGTNLFDLSKTVNHFGFKSLGVKLSYKQLKEAPLPAMLFWNENHFVVLYKFNNDSLFIADPALGKVKYSKDIFCKHWYGDNIENSDTGIALLVEMVE